MLHGDVTDPQVVGDDAAMATPPHRFGAHDRAAPLGSESHQLAERLLELLRQRIVRIIMEALVVPVAVKLRIDIVRSAAKSAQTGNPDVSELVRLELRGDDILVILRVAPRLWHRPDVRHQLNPPR